MSPEEKQDWQVSRRLNAMYGVADVNCGADGICETPTPTATSSGATLVGEPVDSTVPSYTGVTAALDAAVSPHNTLMPERAPLIWPTPAQVELVRKFDTGATRSAETGRYDPEGFLSPLVIERYCEYMNANRVQPDGSVRDSDNWQKGIPLATYMKGLWRHFLHAWHRHRGWPVKDPKAAKNIEEDLCAILFNASGYLHETLKAKESHA